MVYSLDGKVIAVTGASGIGAAAARRFASAGARVQVLSLHEAEAAAVAAELADGGTETFRAAVDLTDGDAAEAALGEGRARLGRRAKLLELWQPRAVASGEVWKVDPAEVRLRLAADGVILSIE